jgi:hypothetical protein
VYNLIFVKAFLLKIRSRIKPKDSLDLLDKEVIRRILPLYTTLYLFVWYLPVFTIDIELQSISFLFDFAHVKYK